MFFLWVFPGYSGSHRQSENMQLGELVPVNCPQRTNDCVTCE